MNVKLAHLYAIFLMGSLLLISSCSENITYDSEEVAVNQNFADLDTNNKTIVVVYNDVKFLIDVADMQLEEIRLGKLAQQKGITSKVKGLGKMLEEAHTKIYNELSELSKSKSVAIPTSITENTKDIIKELNEKAENEFGKSYSNMMVNHNVNAIQLFEKASKGLDDRELRTWAASKLPILRTHLKHAKACKKETDKY